MVIASVLLVVILVSVEMMVLMRVVTIIWLLSLT